MADNTTASMLLINGTKVYLNFIVFTAKPKFMIRLLYRNVKFEWTVCRINDSFIMSIFQWFLK